MAHTFVYDLDFAIEELVSLDALVSATRRDLEMMRAHQDYAFKIEDADGDHPAVTRTGRTHYRPIEWHHRRSEMASSRPLASSKAS